MLKASNYHGLAKHSFSNPPTKIPCPKRTPLIGSNFPLTATYRCFAATLVQNYRSHSTLLDIPNTLFYNGTLVAAADQSQLLPPSWSELEDLPAQQKSDQVRAEPPQNSICKKAYKPGNGPNMLHESLSTFYREPLLLTEESLLDHHRVLRARSKLLPVSMMHIRMVPGMKTSSQRQRKGTCRCPAPSFLASEGNR